MGKLEYESMKNISIEPLKMQHGIPSGPSQHDVFKASKFIEDSILVKLTLGKTSNSLKYMIIRKNY